jgi:ferredoxin
VYATSDELGSCPTFFPHDATPEICATGAIRVGPHGAPTIDNASCIICGLCAVRCPVGAIGLNSKGAFVNDAGSRAFQDLDQPLARHQELSIVQSLAKAKRIGSLVAGGETSLLGNFYQTTCETVGDVNGPRLVRNAMLAIQNRWWSRRTGDNAFRMDAIFKHGGKMGTAEVELSESAALESPRAVLDNLAVLSSRYNFSEKSVIPLIVTLSLPNKRSEYYRVIDDSKRVLGIRILSVTIGVLLLAAWERRPIAFSRLHATESAPSIRSSVEAMLGRSLSMTDSYAGLVGPFK